MNQTYQIQPTPRSFNPDADARTGEQAQRIPVPGEFVPQMKVLMLTWEYPPFMVGGLGKHVAALAPALARLGVDVHVVTPRHRAELPALSRQDNVHVHRVDLPYMATGDIVTDAREANRQIIAWADALVAEHGPFDLIHAHDWLVAESAFHFKHQYKCPLIGTIHATERGRRSGNTTDTISSAIDRLEWQLAFESWRVIVTSQYMANEVMEFFQLPQSKIDIIPNGIDLQAVNWLRQEEAQTFRRRFVADDERLVFCVARLVWEKGVQTLVAAAPEILREFPATRFVVAGRGPMYDELTRMADELGVAGQMDFVGYISDDDRDRLYQVADVVVIPSLYEPFGIVALEALAASVPVAAARTGGLAETFAWHEMEMIHPPGDAGALAHSVCFALRHPHQARIWAATTLERCLRTFNWHSIAEQTAQVFAKVVEERRHVDW